MEESIVLDIHIKADNRNEACCLSSTSFDGGLLRRRFFGGFCHGQSAHGTLAKSTYRLAQPCASRQQRLA